MSYSDKLPSGIEQKKRGRCQALDADGNRCRKIASYEITFHGDPEIVFDEPLSWVAIQICDYHMPNDQMARFIKKAGGIDD